MDNPTMKIVPTMNPRKEGVGKEPRMKPKTAHGVIMKILFDGFLSCLEKEHDWQRIMHFEFVSN